MRSAICAAVLVALSLPDAAAATQDPTWWEDVRSFCNDVDSVDALTVRRALEGVNDPEGTSVARAMRAVLLDVSVRGKKGRKLVKKLSKYVSKVGEKPSGKKGHRRALKVAISIGGPVGTLLAYAHVDHLLAAGENPDSLESEIKKLKLVADGTVLGTNDGLMLARAKKIEDPVAAAGVLQTRDPGLIYCAAVVLMRGIDNDHKTYAALAVERLTALRRWSVEHTQLLIKVLSTIQPCASCADQREVACFNCKGRGRRRFPCPRCEGKGWIEWDPRIEKPEERKENDSKMGFGGAKSYCPVCFNLSKGRWQTRDCESCETKGRVLCQRCRYSKYGFEMVGEIVKCGNCAETGFMFKTLRHPCAFCKGVGGFLQPVADPSVTVGPDR